MASREIRGRRGACRAVAVLGLPASAATGMELCHQELNGEAVSVVIITPPELFADAAAGYSASPLLEQAGGRRPGEVQAQVPGSVLWVPRVSVSGAWRAGHLGSAAGPGGQSDL